MKRISKLVFSICCLIISVTLSVAGIFAATQISLTVSSSVSFIPTDIGLQIAGQMVNSTKTKGEYYFDRTFDGKNYVNYTSEDTYSFKTWQFDAQYDPDKVLSDYNNGTNTSTITFYIQMKNYIDFDVELEMTMGQFWNKDDGTKLSDFIEPVVTAYDLDKAATDGNVNWWNFATIEEKMKVAADAIGYNGYSPEYSEGTKDYIQGYKDAFAAAAKSEGFEISQNKNEMVKRNKNTKYHAESNYALYDYTTNQATEDGASQNIVIKKFGSVCLKIDLTLKCQDILNGTTTDINSNFMMIFAMQKKASV